MHRLMIYFFLFVNSIYCQTKYQVENFERFSRNNGIIDNNVRSLIEDEKGYIWCGTENGLSRFNGRSFLSFDMDDQPSVLKGNYIENMRQLDKHHIGILSRFGLSVIETNNLSPRLIKLQSILGDDITNHVTDCFQFSNGNIGITTISGFYVLDKNDKQIFSYTNYKKEEVGKTRIYFGVDVLKLSSDQILIYAREERLFSYVSSTNTFLALNKDSSIYKKFYMEKGGIAIKEKLSEKEYLVMMLGRNVIRYINEASDLVVDTKIPKEINDLYWASTITKIGVNTFGLEAFNSGFYIFNLDIVSGKITFNLEKQLPHFRCFSLLKTKVGKFFIGTDKGILVEKDSSVFFETMQVRPDNFPTNMFIRKLEHLDHNTMVFAAFNKDIPIGIYDLKQKKIVKTFRNEKFGGVVNLTPFGEDKFIVIPDLMQPHILDVRKNTMIPFNEKVTRGYVIPHNNDDNFLHFINYQSGEILKYNRKTSKLIELPDSISSQLSSCSSPRYDDEGNLWVVGKTLRRLSTNDKLTSFKNVDDNKTGTNYFSVWPSKNKNVWYTNLTGQILCLNTENNKITTYNSKQKKPFFIIDEIKNKLLMYAGDKLFYFNKDNGELFEISKMKNFPEEIVTSFNTISGKKDSANSYLATSNYLIKLNNKNAEKLKVKPLISYIKVNDSIVIHHPNQKFDLKYNEESIDFFPVLLNFSTEPMLGTYRIDNGPWQIYENDIKFNLLKFGKHHLELSYDSPMGNRAHSFYNFELIPPFYKSMWFYILSFFTIILGIAILIGRRIKASRALMQLNHQLAEAELSALHAQMNPHFIFNGLNSIKGLILNNKNSEASKYLSIFALLIRKSLSKKNKMFISVDDQIEYIKQYLSIEKLRFENLNYDVLVDENIDFNSEMVIPMVLQPLVENAIWHGQKHIASEENIKIKFEIRDDYIVYSVEDFGLGFYTNIELSNREGNNVALKNIEERIQLYNNKYNLNCILKIIDKSKLNIGQGTIVEVSHLSFNE